MAEMRGADVIKIHGASGCGDKPAALERLKGNIKGLPNTSRPHIDMIDPDDIPPCWINKTITVDIEANAKELAIEGLQAAFE